MNPLTAEVKRIYQSDSPPSSVRLQCPHCQQLGFVEGHRFQWIHDGAQNHLEGDNFDGYCGKCNGKFRFSNGTTIVRPENALKFSEHQQNFIKAVFFIVLVAIGFIFASSVFLGVIILTVAIVSILYFASGYQNVKLIGVNNLLDEKPHFPTKFGLETALSQNRTLLHQNKILQERTEDLHLATKVHQKQIISLTTKSRLFMEGTTTFNLEKDLQNRLADAARQGQLTLDGKMLRLYPNGVEYVVSDANGRIDILLTDKDSNFYIIETKLNKVSDETIGQISRYMGWVKKNLNTKHKRVYGLIIGLKADQKLKYAASNYDDIFIFEYDLALRFREVID